MSQWVINHSWVCTSSGLTANPKDKQTGGVKFDAELAREGIGASPVALGLFMQARLFGATTKGTTAREFMMSQP